MPGAEALAPRGVQRGDRARLKHSRARKRANVASMRAGHRGPKHPRGMLILLSVAHSPPPRDSVQRGVKCWGQQGQGFPYPLLPDMPVSKSVVRRLKRVTAVRSIPGMDVYSVWCPAAPAPSYRVALHRLGRWLRHEELQVREAWVSGTPSWKKAGLVVGDNGCVSIAEVDAAARQAAAAELRAAGVAVDKMLSGEREVVEQVVAVRGCTMGGKLMDAADVRSVLRSMKRTEVADLLVGVHHSTLGEVEGETSLKGLPDTQVSWIPLKGKWVAAGGTISQQVSVWQEVGVEQHVLDLVRCVTPQWVVQPAPWWCLNHSSVEENHTFVQAEVQALLATGKMAVWDRAAMGLPAHILQVKVVRSGGKDRLVVNGSLLSACEVDRGYPMAGVDEVASMLGRFTLQGEEYVALTVEDFASAFHQVKVDPSYYRHLCVCLLGVVFYYRVTVFGLKSSCSACCWASTTSLAWATRPDLDIEGCVYVDDNILASVAKVGEGAAAPRARRVRERLHSMGWVTDDTKFQEGACVRGLGYIIDGRAQTLSTQPEKVLELTDLVASVGAAPKVRAREVASLYGKFIHSSKIVPGVLPVLRGVVNNHFREMADRRRWDKWVELSERDRRDLALALRLVTSARPWSVVAWRLPAVVLRMDAAPGALGIVVLDSSNRVLGTLYRRFDVSDEAAHITKKELLSFAEVGHVLEHLAMPVAAVLGRVLLGTDNQAARASVLRGSKDLWRQALVRQFWAGVADRREQVVSVDYVTTLENWVSDWISRIEDMCSSGEQLCSWCTPGVTRKLLWEMLDPSTLEDEAPRLADEIVQAKGCEWKRRWQGCSYPVPTGGLPLKR